MTTTKTALIGTALTLVLGLQVPSAFGTPGSARLEGNTTAFINVHVVSMNPAQKKPLLRRQTVIVQDGRIVEIGKAKRVTVPDGAEIINGKGKLYVLPGLVDMHVHNRDVLALPEDVTPEDIYTMYFANGITTVLDMAGFKQAFQWKKDIDRGKVLGPDFNFTSPLIDERDYASLAQLESTISKWVKRGYPYIKSHAIADPATLTAIHSLANKLEIPVIGHALRPGSPIQDTLAHDPLMIAHIEEILSTSVTSQVDFEGQLATPLRDVAASRVWVTTTNTVYEIIANTVDDDAFARLLGRPEMKYIPPTARSLWEFQNKFRDPSFGGDRDFWMAQLAIESYIANQLVELGALDRLLLGSDAGGPELVLPGFSIHDELRLLVEAGLSPWEATLTGTYNPSVFFGTMDEVGTVEEGKRADLLLVKGNPLKKIGRLAKPAGLMVNGVFLSAADLADRLEALAAKWVS